MQNSRMRERSRSPLPNRDEYEDEQEDICRYDKNNLDSQEGSNISERVHRSNSRDIERDQRNVGKNENAPGKIYVSNLPFQFRWQDVKDLLKNEVGTVNFVDTFDDEFKRPRGCAVVQFRTKDLYDLALAAIPDIEVKGRRLRCYTKDEAFQSRDFKFLKNQTTFPNKRSVLDRIHPRNSRTSPPQRRNDNNMHDYGETYGLSIDFLKSLKISGPLTNRIFVANIDFKVENSDLEKIFQLAGPVVKAEISKDSKDGKSRGMAVVEFEHPVQAVQAISMFHNQIYYERELCVRMDRDVNRAAQQANLPPGLKGIGAGLGINGSALIDSATIRSMQASVEGGSNLMQGSSNMQMGIGNPNNNFNQMGMPRMDNPMGLVAGDCMSMNNSFGNPPIQQGSFSNLDQQRQMGMIQGSINRGMGADMNRGMHSDMNRGISQDMNRGTNANMNRSMGQDMNRGMGQGMNRGIGQDTNRGIGQDTNRGMGQDNNRGMGHDINRGIGQDMNRGMGQDMNRGMGQDMNRGMGQDMNRGMGHDMNRGMGQDMNRGMGQDMNRGMGHGMNRGMASDSNRGMGQDINRGMLADMNRGISGGNNVSSFGSEGVVRNDNRKMSGFRDNAGGRGNGLPGMNRDVGSSPGYGGRFGADNAPASRVENSRHGAEAGFKGPGGGSMSNYLQSRKPEQRRGGRMPTIVHITNLPLDYTWQNLRNLCTDYGEVKFAEITDEGVGLVRFETEANAITAAELLDRQRFDGKLLSAEII